MFTYKVTLLSAILLVISPDGTVARAFVAEDPSSAPSVDVLAARHHIFNAVRAAQHQGNDHKASVNLAKSFDDTVLFQLSQSGDVRRDGSPTELSVGIQVSCTTCYVKGHATVALSIENSFNTSQVLDKVEASMQDTLDSIRDYVGNVSSEIADGLLELDFGRLDGIPPPDIDFNVAVDSLPDVQLTLQLDQLEVFMDLTTTLSTGVTYTLNLYSSLTPLGGAIQGIGTVGLVLSVDLILSVESEIHIANGFHIKLDDGLLVDIALFSKKVSQLAFKGGQFEFLPVKIQTSDAVFTSILQLGLHAGVGSGINTGVDALDASFGVETKIFANIVEFVTNITATATTKRDEEAANELNCPLRAQHAYQFGLGAAAGATVALNGQIWGPSPETTVPIYYTTLADVCVDGTPTSAPTGPLRIRQDGDGERSLETVTRTATQCASSSGLINCPASLQLVREYIATETPRRASIFQTVDFGAGVNSLDPSSGVPKSYIPPPKATASSVSNDGQGKDDSDAGDGGSKKPNVGLILGLSVGLGVPALLAVLAALWWFKRRRAADGTVVAVVPAEAQLPSTDNSHKPPKASQRETEISPSDGGK
ncbi:hypothetical protein NLU13_7202 [Sarocladium strictum]|uniref:Mid2 domain-containing protein n=1 Tax=Sarocladium strictum TaxID=5046 RepID=A0AA39L5L1_SARSR|nr:hypothetical protein NLU13_7202 [Sarocladium strictum]